MVANNTPALARNSMDGGISWPGKALLQLLSPGGHRGLSILIFHRVLRTPDPLFPGEVDEAEFTRQVSLLTRHFNVIPLLDAAPCRRARPASPLTTATPTMPKWRCRCCSAWARMPLFLSPPHFWTAGGCGTTPSSSWCAPRPAAASTPARWAWACTRWTR
jgi:hypothetical protein